MGGQADKNDLVQQGTWGEIRCAVDANGNMPAMEFIQSLKPRDSRKLAVLFERLAESGKIHNREQFKKLEGAIFEFKRHQIRVGCFQEGRTWFLTHGFRKKRAAWPRREVDRAERIMNEHRERAHGNAGKPD